VLCLLDRLAGRAAERPLRRFAGSGVGALEWRDSGRFAVAKHEARNHAAR
jgi:hypothetical protein